MMSLTRLFSALTAVLFITILTVSASAGSITFTTVLSGSNEVPAKVSQGTGTVSLIVDDVTGQASLSISFTGLSTPVTGAHIHCCAGPSGTAPVIVPFDSFLILDAAKTSGSLSNYSFTFTAQQVTDLKNGLMYANVHTSTNPGGEIRGQLVAAAPVPEPGTLFLMGTGLFSLAGMMRRRRK